MLNIKKDLENALKDVRWEFVGLLDKHHRLHPLPKNIQIQALFEYLATKKIEVLAKKWGCQIIEAQNTRSYPDITLEGGVFGSKKIALDIKTTRRIDSKQVSGFTIGSYAGYFRQPNRKMAGCREPYGIFAQHWIVGFIYDWNEKANTLNMVSNIELIVQEKWKIASKSTGTGTTTAIRSVKSISLLRKGVGDFRTESDFYKYWRNY